MAGSLEQRRFAAALVWVGVFALAGPIATFAHEGPPFPILMDEPLAGYAVSVWADPDIGEAQFFIIVESPEGGMPAETPEVAMWIEPVDGRLDRVSCETTKQSLRNQMQFEAAPYFDQRDMWTVGFRLTAPDGETGEVTTEVESTPPGYGPWDLAIYLFPFLLLGGAWVFAMVRRIRLIRAHHARQNDADSSSGEVQDDRELIKTGMSEEK